ncbi:hypothetical protein SAMN05192535_2845 [Shouchella rhizosphaerae]|nr:hypothetical protein DB29_00931 [Shouchella clausii]SHL61781.1 hypothetical protein SAMN05192535_2845 [Shouchella rhizosphaerae]
MKKVLVVVFMLTVIFGVSASYDGTIQPQGGGTNYINP